LPLQDIVIVAKNGAADLNYAEVLGELAAVFALSGEKNGTCG
jgi:RNase P protein component